MASGINIGGMKIDEFVEMVSKQTSRGVALEFVGKVLTEAGHEMGRTFSYGTSFAATEPGCGATFARTLNHEDWKDGQDLVQAEESTGELGFNVRFHAIEADLDSLGTDVRKVFSCLAEMRSELADRLGEIRAEINLINQDLKRLEACCDEDRPSPTVRPDRWHPDLPDWYDRWKYDPRIWDVVDLARVLTKHDKLRRFFEKNPVSKRELVKEFGDLETEGGRTLEDLTDILPDQGRYSSVKGLLKAVSDRQAAAIRTGGRVEQVINAVFGGNLIEGSALSEADLVSFQLIPEDERRAISAAGVDTLGALAGQTAKGLVTIMDDAGFDVGEDETAGWVAAAEMLMDSTH